MAEVKGVLAQHRDLMENDSDYREAALTAPAPVRGKFLTNTAPTLGQADRTAEADVAVASEVQRPRPIDNDPGMSETTGLDDGIDALAGEDLDKAVADADIAGRSSMTAEEKRAALRNRRGTQGGTP